MSSRTVYNKPHGRSGKRWSGTGVRGARNEPLNGYGFHRFPIFEHQVIQTVSRVNKKLAKRNRQRESRLELYEQIIE